MFLDTLSDGRVIFECVVRASLSPGRPNGNTNHPISEYGTQNVTHDRIATDDDDDRIVADERGRLRDRACKTEKKKKSKR